MSETAPALPTVKETISRLVHLHHSLATMYQHAIDMVESDVYRPILRAYLQQSERFSMELEILALSDTSPAQTHPNGHKSAHSIWFHMEKIRDGGDAAILALCLRGEEETVRTYQAVLEQRMPGDVRAVLRDQCNALLAARPRLQQLRSGD